MNTRMRDFAILAAMPLFFVSNLIIGRPAVETVPPWTLAALRWTFACLILAPFALPAARMHAATLIAKWKLITLLGFLGMWICGGIVYVALQYTTATHGTLIYTASPVIVVLLGAVLARRPLPLGQMIGVLLGVAGVFTIVLEGQPAAIFTHHFNVGDLVVRFRSDRLGDLFVVVKERGIADRANVGAVFRHHFGRCRSSDPLHDRGAVADRRRFPRRCVHGRASPAL